MLSSNNKSNDPASELTESTLISPTLVMSPSVTSKLVEVSEVNVPAAAELAPITVPSMAPPLMSTLVIATEPVPLGIMLMSSLDLADVMLNPLMSKLPPNCGVVSSTIESIPWSVKFAHAPLLYPSMKPWSVLYLISPLAEVPR